MTAVHGFSFFEDPLEIIRSYRKSVLGSGNVQYNIILLTNYDSSLAGAWTQVCLC